VLADGGSVVAIGNTDGLYARLISLGLINSASLVNSCNAGKPDALYNFVPSPIQSLDRFVVTRASTKNVLGSAGLYVSVANDTPAFEFNTDGTYRGLLVEPGATNLALNSRNLTTASWTASNVTTAQTATGADGGANSATTLTATDANGTVLQSITSASASRVFSAVVRRRTGTGTVEITQDNGSTWTAITLTTSYQRFATPAQTLTNPTVGFRIVTSGDAIDVDFCQAETGSVATSPIVTTAGTANRAADVVSLTGASSLIGQTEGGTMFVEVDWRGISGLANQTIFEVSNGLATNRANLFVDFATNQLRMFVNANNVAQTLQGVSSSEYSGIQKLALRYKQDDTVMYRNGALQSTDVSVDLTALATLNSVTIGHRFDGTNQANMWIRSVALFPTPLADAQLESLTTL
jgi:hypothetical protein